MCSLVRSGYSLDLFVGCLNLQFEQLSPDDTPFPEPPEYGVATLSSLVLQHLDICEAFGQALMGWRKRGRGLVAKWRRWKGRDLNVQNWLRLMSLRSVQLAFQPVASH